MMFVLQSLCSQQDLGSGILLLHCLSGALTVLISI